MVFRVQLLLISLLWVSVALAQTGIDGVDTPHLNCTLGQMDFSLNSSTKECSHGNCCPTGFHCGPTFTPTPTPCDCETFTPTVTVTPTRTRTPSPTPT